MWLLTRPNSAVLEQKLVEEGAFSVPSKLWQTASCKAVVLWSQVFIVVGTFLPSWYMCKLFTLQSLALKIGLIGKMVGADSKK